MNEQMLDLLYNQKSICEVLLKKGYDAAARLFYEKALVLREFPEDELPIQRCIFLNSLNKSIYNFILYAWDISLSQCCYDNLSATHRYREEHEFLEAGNYILKTYARKIYAKRSRTAHIEHACSYINHHLDEKLTLDLVSQKIYVSKTYLSQMFKEYTGYSFSEYITNQRITRARHLLLTTDDNIDQIAEKCGFFSSTYFSATFKKSNHLSPRLFRKHYQNTAQTGSAAPHVTGGRI